MNLEFNCPYCDRLLAIDEKWEKTEVECPSCGNSLVPGRIIAKEEEVQRAKKKEEKERPQKLRKEEPILPNQQASALKNPGLSATLSFFITGIGQIYNEQVGKGVCFMIACVICLVLCAEGVGLGFILLIPLWMWSIIDAHKVAYLINRKRRMIPSNIAPALLFLFAVFFVLIFSIMIAPALERAKESAKAPAMSVEEIKSNASAISYDNLMRNNKDYVGEIIYYRGKVIQVSEIYGDKYVLRIATKEGTYIGYVEDIIWVNYKGKRLLEDDLIDVWGKAKGFKTYTAVLKHRITIPEVDSLHVELVTKAGEQ